MRKQLNFEHFVWLDFSNPNLKDLDGIAQTYGLHNFQIKDSIEVGHLPKIEIQASYSFIILRAISHPISAVGKTISDLSNKIAFFISERKLITIHNADFDFLNLSKVDFKNPEELMAYIVYKMIDSFNSPLEHLEASIEKTEEWLFLKNTKAISLQELYYHKTQARILKKLISLTMGVLNKLDFKEEHKIKLQDSKDSLLQFQLKFEEVFETSNHLLDSFISVSDQKNNEVMKLLTVFSAFFLPLTFLVGVYGMNFENMPELKTQNGYFVLLIVMLFVSLIIFGWFKRKKIL